MIEDAIFRRKIRARILSPLAILGVALGCGPMGPFPGGKLQGELVSGPTEDWSFVDDVEVIQLETRPDDPHSVNTWVVAYQGNPYVPTSLILGTETPAKRDWVSHVSLDPRVRLRIAGKLYERQAVRVGNVGELDAVRARFFAKYEVDRKKQQANEAWIFRMEKRR